MNQYVLTLVLKPDLEEKARKEFLDGVKKRFASVVKEDVWGTRDLAYPVKHFTKGWYVHYNFLAEPSSILSLDKALKMEEDIIRYLIVRV